MSSRNHMPSVEFINFEGLYTKQNPETLQVTQLRECKNADFFREYGSLSKMRGTTRILSSQYSESGTIKDIAWGAFYKAQDLSGEIVRDVLIGAGTTIQKINSDGSLTELLSGEPDGLFRTSDQLDRFRFITSQDPFSVGNRGQMSRYDGTRISQWGITSPGEQETEMVSFDDYTIFTANNSTLADSTRPAFKGTATSMTKGVVSTASYMEDLNRGTAVPVNTVIEDRVRMNFFIDREDFRTLSTSGRAVSIYMGSNVDLAGNYYRYDFQIGRLAEGWNTLTMDFSTFPSGDFGTTVGIPDDDALISFRFEIITNNATDVPVVYWDNLVTLDQGAPIPTFADPGGTVFPSGGSGQWWIYGVTFVDDAGNESNSGPDSIEADNTTGTTDYGQVNLTELPVSTNPAVVKRDIYRTTAGGATLLYLDTINDNVSTTYTDTTPDTSLGTTQPPLLGDAIFDHSPAPFGGIALIWKRTAFIAGDPLNPTILSFSRYDYPEAFPILNAIEFDERITGMFKTYLGIVVTTETSYWRIIGDNPDYTVDQVIQGFGGVGSRAVGTAREVGWAVDRDGMRLYDLRESIKVSEVMRDRVDAFYKGSLSETHTSHSHKHNALLWFTKDEDGNYTDSYVYQYMIDDVRKGWFGQMVPNPTTFNMLQTWEIEDSNGAPRLYCGTDQGMVLELMADDALNWVDSTGASRAITMEIRIPFIRLGVTPEAMEYEGTSGRVTPRFLELRIKENNGAAHTWTMTIDTSDSASENATLRDTQDVTFSFPAGCSLLRLSTQDLTPGEYLRFTLKNEEKDKDVQIMGVKIFYHVRPGQYPVTGDPVAGGGQN